LKSILAPRHSDGGVQANAEFRIRLHVGLLILYAQWILPKLAPVDHLAAILLAGRLTLADTFGRCKKMLEGRYAYSAWLLGGVAT